MTFAAKNGADESSATKNGADENSATEKDTRVNLLNFDRRELASELQTALNIEPFRAQQLIQWVYKYRVTEFSAMTNIAREVRTKLEDRYYIYRPKVHTIQQSIDGSRKFLFELSDGSKVESVLIHQPSRWTLCISSQVGCAIGCAFCRTGTMGLKRHLETAEIIGQVLAVQDDIAARGAEFFTNIVFMGMGEPLHNFDNVIRTLSLLNDELGLNFSGRKITVSTSGLVPQIEKLGKSNVAMNLAVSLNATTDEVRDVVIPINKRWPIQTLLDELRRYPLRSRKRITIEYVMLAGVNDTDADLARLPELLHGIPVKVNLIPYNDNAGLGYKTPERHVIARWQETLLSQGLNATVRWSKGVDISAACGQLATEPRRAPRSLPIASEAAPQ